MENKNSSNSSLATPLAIIVAGFMIASAIYVSNSQIGFLKSKSATDPAVLSANANDGQGNGQDAQPGTAQQPTQNPEAVPEETGPQSLKIGQGPVLGDAKAPVTMVLFTDFRCPFCARFDKDAFVQIKKNYIDTSKVKFVLRNLSIHPPESDDAAAAALCADEQKKYWEYSDLLFTKLNAGDSFDAKTLKSYAGTLGLNQASFDACVDAGKYEAQVASDSSDARDAGATGTPTIFVGKSDASGTIEAVKVVGAQPFETFAAEIDKLLL